MKVAFISEQAEDDVRAFSGIPYFMRRHLEACVTVERFIHSPMIDLAVMLCDPVAGEEELRQAGRSASRQLADSSADVVICSGSSMIPYLETDKPVVLWHDSTWRTLFQMTGETFESHYPALNEWDRRVIDRCQLVVFAADWVRDEVAADRPLDGRKLSVIPFGPSLYDEFFPSIEERIARRGRSACELTFIGVDWIRKGLPLAYDVATELARRGVPTMLNVIGTDIGQDGQEPGGAEQWQPHRPFSRRDLVRLRLRCDPQVRLWGFLSKASASEYRRFCQILGATHFLLHPASFECFGVALTEANAMGVPALAIDQFGPKTIIRDGINGRLFAAGEYVNRAAEFIQTAMDGRYAADALGSLDESRKRLNWSTAVRELVGLIDSA